MVKRNGMVFRCRACGTVFGTKPSPNRAVLVKCRKCGSDDVEVV